MLRHSHSVSAAFAVAAVLGLAGGCPGPTTYEGNDPPTASDQLVDPNDLDAGIYDSARDTTQIKVSELAGAGGKVVHQRTLYTGDDTVDCGTNDLLIVESGGKLYLYNPALGDVELSEATNRAALACYLFGATPTSKTTNATVIGLRQNPVLLSTKVAVSRPSTGTMHVENQLNRFVVVRRSTQAEGLYLAPSNKRFDANWLRKFVDVAAARLEQEYPTVFDATALDISMSSGQLETFGASFNYFGAPLPATDAYAHGLTLMEELDALQEAYIWAECWKLAFDVFPLEAGDALIGLMFDVYQAYHMPDTALRTQQIIALLENFAYSAGTGIAEGFGVVSGGWPGAALVIFNTLNDLYAGVSFLDEEGERIDPAWQTATCYDVAEIEAVGDLYPGSYYGDVTMTVEGASYTCSLRIEVWDGASPIAIKMHLDVPEIPHFMLGTFAVDRWYELGQGARTLSSTGGAFHFVASDGAVIDGVYLYEQAEGTIDFQARNPDTGEDDDIHVTFRIHRVA